MTNFLIISMLLMVGAFVFMASIWAFFLYIILKEEEEKLQKAIRENKIHLTRDSDLG